ncbi:Flp family type IVb pilin [Oceanisphaera sp.]|uniref:Flp family type IVb pilin n=1 Tax=Oceanisphaera sp. TaxID=1929979 RepID=UPI003A927245
MLILKELNRLLNDEEGLTVVEYAIAGGVIAAGVVVLFTTIGGHVDTKITQLELELQDTAAAATPED